MALQKTKELASGLSADYIKIESVRLDGLYTSCVVKTYKDAAARQASKQSVLHQEFQWSGDENPCTIAAMDVVSSNPIKLCYAKLKTLDEFSGASDV